MISNISEYKITEKNMTKASDSTQDRFSEQVIDHTRFYNKGQWDCVTFK